MQSLITTRTLSTPSEIRELTAGKKLRHNWDTNGDDASAKYRANALSSGTGGHFGIITTNNVS
jgi:hypothetical protein